MFWKVDMIRMASKMKQVSCNPWHETKLVKRKQFLITQIMFFFLMHHVLKKMDVIHTQYKHLLYSRGFQHDPAHTGHGA